MTRTNPSQDKPKVMQRTKPARKSHWNYNLPGRKGVYDDRCPERAYELSKIGLTDKQLALAFGIHIDTIYTWKADHEDFLYAIIAGKEIHDNGVQKTLLQRAMGYEYEEVSTTKRKTKEGELITNITSTTKHILPDVTAMIFWLKNRHKAQWADVHRQEITSNLNIRIPKPSEIQNILSPQEQELIQSIALKQTGAIKGVSSN